MNAYLGKEEFGLSALTTRIAACIALMDFGLTTAATALVRPSSV
jgi:hypothetical protein